MLKNIFIFFVCALINIPFVDPSYAFIGIGSAASSLAEIPYLAKILVQSIKQYEQLRLIIAQGKGNEYLLRTINDGINNAQGLLQSLPVQGDGVLDEIKRSRNSYSLIEDLYGETEKSSEGKLLELHDKTVAESIKMAVSLDDYAKTQEENSKMIFRQSESASPKGAMRMNAQVNSQILHTLSQLLKVNGQTLKLQSEILGLNNKNEKESLKHFRKINMDISNNQLNSKLDFKLNKF
ncbi:MAG: hypothetical protein HQK51_05570 [Oligoflexia bacterium]|nr:hypothetical protein [Oligoflexia bacterium]